MEDFTFDELIDMVKEVYGHFRNDAKNIGGNDNQSLERFYAEYQNIIERGISETTIIFSTLCLELKKYKVECLSERQYKRLNEALDKFEGIKVSDILTMEQVKLLEESVISSMEYLKGIQVV